MARKDKHYYDRVHPSPSKKKGNHDDSHEEVVPSSEPLMSLGLEQVPTPIHEEVKTPSPDSPDFGGDTSGKRT